MSEVVNNTDNKKFNRALLLSTIALCAISICASFPGMTNPAIQKFIEAFPNIDTVTIRKISALPQMVAKLIAVPLGFFVGKKIKFRHIMIFGVICCTVGGIMPYFMHDTWSQVLMWRFVVGIGVGIMQMRNAAIMATFPGNKEQQKRVVGMAQGIGNVFSTIAQTTVGVLADITWEMAFLPYFIGVLILIASLLWLRIPADEDIGKKNADGSSKIKLFDFSTAKFNWRILYCYIYAQLIFIWMYCFNSGVSSYVQALGFGTAATAGTALSCYTFVGALWAMVLPKTTKIIGTKNIFWACSLAACIGMVCLVNAKSMVLIYVATIFLSFSYLTQLPGVQYIIGSIGRPENIALNITLSGLVGFYSSNLSSYWIKWSEAILHTGLETFSAYKMSMYVYAAFTLFTFLFNKVFWKGIEDRV